MTDLLLGPLLRWVGRDDDGSGAATVWVETSGPAEVEVLGCRSRTFCVAGQHFAIVVVHGLPPSDEVAYEVALDGERVWPPPGWDWPASVIRTRRREDPVRLAFGSCRLTGPLDDPVRGVDALHALAERMRRQEPAQWPHELLLVGDQVYADEKVPPATAELIRRRRPPDVGAGRQVADLTEYASLYREAWTPAPIRWLLSTVPTAMVFDDHDVHDDWNTSRAWRDAVKALDWWQERIESALMGYWLYQHLGNLSAQEVRADPLLAAIRAEPDGEPLLRAHARRADGEADAPASRDAPTRWSYTRDLGTSRMLVLDSRCGRVLADDHRSMLDEAEWAWVEDQVAGDHDHLLLATSVPYLVPPAVHHLEAFDEALTAGAWGRGAARVGEWLRQAADLEHWAAFGQSFQRMADLVAEVAAGHRGRAPATVTFLSGDVHFAYLARARYRDRSDVRSAVYQAVCSPLRNPLPGVMKGGQRLACSRTAAELARGLARTAGVARPSLEWTVVAGPAFGNEVATLELAGRSARLLVERAVPGPRLARSFAAQLS